MFLVIFRGEDRPSIEMLTRVQLLGSLSREWKSYNILASYPHIMYMPNNSIFIMKGDIVLSIDHFQLIVKDTIDD